MIRCGHVYPSCLDESMSLLLDWLSWQYLVVLKKDTCCVYAVTCTHALDDSNTFDHHRVKRLIVVAPLLVSPFCAECFHFPSIQFLFSLVPTILCAVQGSSSVAFTLQHFTTLDILPLCCLLGLGLYDQRTIHESSLTSKSFNMSIGAATNGAPGLPVPSHNAHASATATATTSPYQHIADFISNVGKFKMYFDI